MITLVPILSSVTVSLNLALASIECIIQNDQEQFTPEDCECWNRAFQTERLTVDGNPVVYNKATNTITIEGPEYLITPETVSDIQTRLNIIKDRYDNFVVEKNNSQENIDNKKTEIVNRFSEIKK